MAIFDSITPAQFERLPTVLQDVVNYERELCNLRRRAVVDFAEFKRVRNCLREAYRGAEHLWGYQLRGDGTAPA